jgi:lipoate-protein ligase A
VNILEPLHLYEESVARSAALNMAIDEALLETVAIPSLRVYRWRKPALSFGYFGSFSDVANQQRTREIVRRWTGGGIVPHGDDLTYSIVIPANHWFFSRSSLEIYSAIHEAIRRALNKNGVEVTLANSVTPRVSENCFANPVPADVLKDGQKIAGAAHRRSRMGLLHQGSIQMAGLPHKFTEDFARTLCPQFERKDFSQELLARATAVAQSKYGTDAWLLRR